MTDFIKKLNGLSKAMKVIPVKMGAEAVRFSKQRFQEQNWVDSSSKTWSKRKPQKGSKQRNKRGVLTDTGRLRRSIRKLSSTANSVTIGTDVPYAQIHNEGGKVRAKQRVRSHQRKRNGKPHKVRGFERTITFTMPQRKFLGNSAFLAKRVERIMAAEFSKALKK